MTGRVDSGRDWEIREGDQRDVLAGVQADTLIVDAPYSDRTHSGHDSVVKDVNDAGPRDNRKRLDLGLDAVRRSIVYRPWSDEDVRGFCESWVPRVRGWFVTITDHVLSRAWSEHLDRLGRYVFAPLPLVERGSRVRLAGDGPSTWTCWIIVARPRTAEYAKWGTLPGAYVVGREVERRAVVGGKPLGVMRALVRDYSRPGDLVVDPCAGGGTTILAAATEHRRGLGAEINPAHYDHAVARLRRGFTRSLFSGAEVEHVQGALALDPDLDRGDA